MNLEGCSRQISEEQKNGDPEGGRKSGFPPPLRNLLNQAQFGLAILFSNQQHTLKVKLLNCVCLTRVVTVV